MTKRQLTDRETELLGITNDELELLSMLINVPQAVVYEEESLELLHGLRRRWMVKKHKETCNQISWSITPRGKAVYIKALYAMNEGPNQSSLRSWKEQVASLIFTWPVASIATWIVIFLMFYFLPSK